MFFFPPGFLNLILLLKAISKGRLQVCSLFGRESIIYLVPDLLLILDSKMTTGEEHVPRSGNISEMAFLLLAINQ